MNFDLQKEILRRLPVTVTLKCRHVCKAWRDFIHSPSCWVHRSFLTLQILTHRTHITYSLFDRDKKIVSCTCGVEKNRYRTHENINQLLYYGKFAQVLHIDRGWIQTCEDEIVDILKSVQWRFRSFAYSHSSCCGMDENAYTLDKMLMSLLQSRSETLEQFNQIDECQIYIDYTNTLPPVNLHVDIVTALCQLRATKSQLIYAGWDKIEYGYCPVLDEDLYTDVLEKYKLQATAEYRYTSRMSPCEIQIMTFNITKRDEPPYAITIERKELEAHKVLE